MLGPQFFCVNGCFCYLSLIWILRRERVFEATETREEQRWDRLGRFFKVVLVDRPRSSLLGVWVGSVMGSYPSSDSGLCLGPPSPGSQDGD